MSYEDASPRPWSAEKARTLIHLSGANGHPIASITVSPPRVPEKEIRESHVRQAHGNVEMILRAVNSHEALVDCLRDCVKLLEFLEPEVPGGFSPDGALGNARALLDSLEG